MAKQIQNNHERNPTPLPLLIAAHCSTIRRKTARIDKSELSAILNDLVRELHISRLPLKSYLNCLNEIVKTLNSHFPSILLELASHYFFILIRNTIRNVLQQLHSSNEFNSQEVYLLRNCTLLLHRVVKEIDNVSKVVHCFSDTAFLDAVANCLNHINKISKANESRLFIKQITRLLGIISNVQERLPMQLHNNLFAQLLEPTINCLTSSNYLKLFLNLKVNEDSCSEKQKFYLIKCPYFLTTYNGPHIEKAIEHILEVMLPRYVSILDKHMKTIKEWNHSMMRAMHNLIITIVYAEGFFSSHTNSKSFRLLVNHLLHLLNEPTLVNKIQPNSSSVETLLIDAALVAFSILVYEPNALDYIKTLKPIATFQKLTKKPHETIVLNAYMMLAYVIDEKTIQASVDDLSQLLFTTLNLLGNAIENRHEKNDNERASRETIDRNIIQLIETLKGLAQYQQIKNQILKKGLISTLVAYYEKSDGLPKQLLLECIWTLSFNEQIAQQLCTNSKFIASLENITKLTNDGTQQDTIRHSNSYCSRQNGTVVASSEGTHNGIQKVTDGLLWKLVNENAFREQLQKQKKKNQNYKYDVMISYCHADKDIVHKIQKFLTNEGYDIWINRSHKHRQRETTMEAVADAIENSEFVIICMSDSYKRDNHCQAEIEYAFNSKRSLIPLFLRQGYQPDQWFASMISTNSYIDFAGSDFKRASSLLLEEIRQRKCKKQIDEAKPPASTSTSSLNDTSISSTVSDTNSVTVVSSTSTASTNSVLFSVPTADFEAQPIVPLSSISRSQISGTTSSTKYAVVDKQQTGFARSTTQPSINASISHVISDGITEQQESHIYNVSRSYISGVMPSTKPTIDMHQRQSQVPPISVSAVSDGTGQEQQQQQKSIISTFTIPTPTDVDTSTMSPFINKQNQNHQILMRPVVLPPMVNVISSVTSTAVDKQQTYQQQQQQQSPMYPASKPIATNNTAFANTTFIGPQQEQIPKRSVSQSPVPGSSYSTAPTNFNTQKQKPIVPPVLTSLPPGTVSTGASNNVDCNWQQALVLAKHQTSTTHTVSSGTSTNMSPQQQPMHGITGPPTNGVGLAGTQAVIDKNQQESKLMLLDSPSSPSSFTSPDESTNYERQSPRQVIVFSMPRPPIATKTSPSSTSTVASQQQTSLYPLSQSLSNNRLSSASPISIDKQQQQQQQIPIHSIPQPQTFGFLPLSTSVANDRQPQPAPLHPNSQSLTNNTVTSPLHIVVDKQQQRSMNSASQAPPSTSSEAIPVVIEQQQQRTLQHSSSYSTTPPTLPVASSIHPMLSASSQTTPRVTPSLPEVYTNRKIGVSTYHNIPINAWKRNDVLDFLFDSCLYAMMPLCESMSGKALIRFFRMCQEKPSRLYGQLNEELRVRFKGITLPMGVYTEFLTEMDSLLNPEPETTPQASFSTQPIVERVMLRSRAQQQPIQIPASSRFSTYSTASQGRSRSLIPLRTIEETRNTDEKRFSERVIFRPPSSSGRPYSLIVESLDKISTFL
ncbi:unnamed protein product [Rotaria magnacalcarata]|uniref:TIR domain-containing protein n=5 Tax=Rotaria magnacalcarata TaxID=392030 RepID=A0A819UEK9_9BILA|nr:unnamed protein product [Rotaria magnacalcarata]CAF2103966.1 unnamed protein product [Rotaria magnacalcarata]CAF4039397.1 unnamed protein product [Rotaria magnacalcarata]CAF4090858.1 unnamed protein product [Rotaria magnacalcarata]